MTMATVNPKLSSLNYVNKEHEESLKGITSHLHFVVDDFYKLLQAYITHLYIHFSCMELLLGGTLTNHVNPNYQFTKRVLRIITFSNYNDHSNPLFKALEIIKFEDIIFLHNAIFMYDFHSGT